MLTSRTGQTQRGSLLFVAGRVSLHPQPGQNCCQWWRFTPAAFLSANNNRQREELGLLGLLTTLTTSSAQPAYRRVRARAISSGHYGGLKSLRPLPEFTTRPHDHRFRYHVRNATLT